jgi:hypothetical protein
MHCSFAINLTLNTSTIIPKTNHQVKRLKKNTSAKRHIALANAEAWLADGDNCLDSMDLFYLIIKRSNYITLKRFCVIR